VKNAENPKSNVIPLSLLWGFLSKHAVEVIWVRAFANEVFPLSMCPKMPMFKFKEFLTFIYAISYSFKGKFISSILFFFLLKLRIKNSIIQKYNNFQLNSLILSLIHP